MRILPALLLITLLAALAACTVRKVYPELTPGSHSADYSQLFGRLQRVNAKNPQDPPAWVLRYGNNDADIYGGRFNLTPPEKLAGYSGGEMIDVRGTIHPEFTHPEFPGTWYYVDSIRLWQNYEKK